jgi:tetratricopeptide (TPR) repeat protein
MNISKLLDFIIGLFKNDRWEDGKKLCFKIIDKDPTCAQAHFMIGIYFKHINNIDTAKNAFLICMKHDVNHVLSYVNIVRILIDQNKFTEASEVINKAKELFPSEYLVYIESSQLYLKSDNINQAILDILVAIKLNPKSETANYNYALILNTLYTNSETEDNKEDYYCQTMIQYMKVLAINPLNTNVLCNYGSMLAKQAEKYNSIANILLEKSNGLEKDNKLREAINLKKHAELNRMYAISYNMDAEYKYLDALNINPSDHLLHFNLGLVLKSLNNLKQAEYHFEKVIEINSSYEEAHIELRCLNGIE